MQRVLAAIRDGRIAAEHTEYAVRVVWSASGDGALADQWMYPSLEMGAGVCVPSVVGYSLCHGVSPTKARRPGGTGAFQHALACCLLPNGVYGTRRGHGIAAACAVLDAATEDGAHRCGYASLVTRVLAERVGAGMRLPCLQRIRHAYRLQRLLGGASSSLAGEWLAGAVSNAGAVVVTFLREEILAEACANPAYLVATQAEWNLPGVLALVTEVCDEVRSILASVMDSTHPAAVWQPSDALAAANSVCVRGARSYRAAWTQTRAALHCRGVECWLSVAGVANASTLRERMDIGKATLGRLVGAVIASGHHFPGGVPALLGRMVATVGGSPSQVALVMDPTVRGVNGVKSAARKLAGRSSPSEGIHPTQFAALMTLVATTSHASGIAGLRRIAVPASCTGESTEIAFCSVCQSVKTARCRPGLGFGNASGLLRVAITMDGTIVCSPKRLSRCTTLEGACVFAPVTRVSLQHHVLTLKGSSYFCCQQCGELATRRCHREQLVPGLSSNGADLMCTTCIASRHTALLRAVVGKHAAVLHTPYCSFCAAEFRGLPALERYIKGKRLGIQPWAAWRVYARTLVACPRCARHDRLWRSVVALSSLSSVSSPTRGPELVRQIAAVCIASSGRKRGRERTTR